MSDAPERLNVVYGELCEALRAMKGLHEHSWHWKPRLFPPPTKFGAVAQSAWESHPEHGVSMLRDQMQVIESCLRAVESLTQPDWRKLFTVASGPSGECCFGAVAQLAQRYRNRAKNFLRHNDDGSFDESVFRNAAPKLAKALEELPILDIDLSVNRLFVEYCRATSGEKLKGAAWLPVSNLEDLPAYGRPDEDPPEKFSQGELSGNATQLAYALASGDAKQRPEKLLEYHARGSVWVRKESDRRFTAYFATKSRFTTARHRLDKFKTEHERTDESDGNCS